MSALTKAQIPDFTTSEQLAAYVGSLMARVNPTVAFLETENTSIKSCQLTIGKAADGTELLIVRMAIPLQPTWDSDKTKPLWQLVGTVSNTVVPPAYLAS